MFFMFFYRATQENCLKNIASARIPTQKSVSGNPAWLFPERKMLLLLLLLVLLLALYYF
jgi:hypothetical protein